MTKPIVIYRKTSGLNTKVDPVELSYSEAGVQELSIAADVDISSRGRISRRKGYGSGLVGNFHSLWCGGGDAIFVDRAAGYLCVIDGVNTGTTPPTITSTQLVSVDPNLKVRACQVNDQIFWTNGEQKGFIYERQNHDWVKGAYVWPTTHRSFSDPPTGSIIEYFYGRMYVAQNNTLWISEPFAFGTFDLARGFIMFSSKIGMVRAVDDGIFVSTGNRVVFLAGTGPQDFRLQTMFHDPAIQGTDIPFFGSLMVYQDGSMNVVDNGPMAVMWMSKSGICFGGSGGKFVVLTSDKIESLPGGLTGSGLFYKGKYIGLIDP